MPCGRAAGVEPGDARAGLRACLVQFDRQFGDDAAYERRGCPLAGSSSFGSPALSAIDAPDRDWARFPDTHDPLPKPEGRARTNARAQGEASTRLYDHDERGAP